MSDDTTAPRRIEINDDDLVAWSAAGQHNACKVRVARAMFRANHPDWSDDRIEQELLTRLMPKGSA